jgi:hypothetical protein
MSDGRCILMGAVASAALLCVGCEKTRPGEPNDPGQQADLREYARALAAANEFCHLWRKGNYDAARAMLDARLIKKHPESLIRGVLSQDANPVHQSYEIHGGLRLSDGSYLFDVKLFFLYRGRDTDRLENPAGQVVLEATDDGRWLVRSFPMLP